jgi:hypothetical protein
LAVAARVLAACKLGKVPDHSWLSKKRSRLPHEVDEKVFEMKIGMATMTRVPPLCEPQPVETGRWQGGRAQARRNVRGPNQ